MPVLKISDKVRKIALEVVRVPLSILGDCPQCQGNGYRDGICPDCNYIDERVLGAIQEWQNAMGIQQQVGEQPKKKKAAYRSLAFTDIMPVQDAFVDFQTVDVPCPKCGQNTFSIPKPNDKVKKSELYNKGGECRNTQCQHEIAGPTGFKRPRGLGLDTDWLKDVGGIRHNFLSPAALKIEKSKNKLKKSSFDPGALQDDSMNAKDDATTRMRSLLLDSAAIDAENKDEKSEELK